MALLRDARTSAAILEGTPEEVALAAAKLDDGAYLFDDVGLDFDADAVRAGHASRVEGLEAHVATLKAAKGDARGPDHAERLKAATAALEEARAPAAGADQAAELAAKRAADAQAGLEG